MKPLVLAEIQGVYGPVTVAERVLQKIWWSGEFRQDDLRTVSGQKLHRLQPGRWNMQEGPDFIGAALQIGGQLVQGDVEVHFYAEDWHGHRHDTDPAFDNVVLHVLLFPPRRAVPLSTRSGRTPAVLVLLPHLPEDIEDYANREALLALETREKSGWLDALLEVRETERHLLLREKAVVRWRQKVRFARQRLERHGWENACHQLALETLGLRRNRAPMSVLAQRHRPEEMARFSAAALFEEQREQWKLAGVRPANHPRRRLEQYLQILANPGWPERLLDWGAVLPDDSGAGELSTVRFQTLRMSRLARWLAGGVLADALGGTRLHTLANDALLPLLAARSGEDDTYASHWQHWLLGDAPASAAKTLRALLPPENTKRSPRIDNGLFQGLLQLGHERG